MDRETGHCTQRTGSVTVLYDGDCGFCRWLLAWLIRWDRGYRIVVEPIQGPEGSRLLADLSPEQRLRSWHSVNELGNRASAGAAFPAVLQVLPGGGPLARLARSLPRAAEAAYRFVARRRRYWARILPPKSLERADRIVEARRVRQSAQLG
jgi:predicted DCC family thiol-disulfide oxidoreductase YuxK